MSLSLRLSVRRGLISRQALAKLVRVVCAMTDREVRVHLGLTAGLWKEKMQKIAVFLRLTRKKLSVKIWVSLVVSTKLELVLGLSYS